MVAPNGAAAVAKSSKVALGHWGGKAPPETEGPKNNIYPTDGGAFNATLRLHYRDSEIPGSVTEAALDLYRFVGGLATICRHRP